MLPRGAAARRVGAPVSLNYQGHNACYQRAPTSALLTVVRRAKHALVSPLAPSLVPNRHLPWAPAVKLPRVIPRATSEQGTATGVTRKRRSKTSEGETPSEDAAAQGTEDPSGTKTRKRRSSTRKKNEPSSGPEEATLLGPESGVTSPAPEEAAAEAASEQQERIFIPSEGQRRAMDVVQSGGNLFLTGCAGTGKSATLFALRKQMAEKYGSFDKRVAVVAMTGLAATIVGGTTLHSLLKLGPAETYKDFRRMEQDEKVQEQLLELRTIMLDEAGMLSAEMLQALDARLTRARKTAVKKMAKECEWTEDERKAALAKYDKPFGGLQLVISGDFFQLPPIEGKPVEPGAPPRTVTHAMHTAFQNRGFVFQAPVFYYGGFELVELTKVFRQDEQDFVALLNSIRCGSNAECFAAKAELRRRCSRELDCSDGIKPTRLFARNNDVLELNTKELGELPGTLVKLAAVDGVEVTMEPSASHYLPLVKEGLLSQQQYEELMHELEPYVELSAWVPEPLLSLGELEMERALELRNDWWRDANQRLWEVGRDTSGLFMHCQAAGSVELKADAQVMLVRNVDVDAKLVNGSRGVVERFVRVDEAMEKQCNALAKSASCGSYMEEWLKENTHVPVVRFTSGRSQAILPAIFTSTVPGYGQCIRVQVPLKLAWAITVHKSQGMTLDKVVVDLRNFFGHGMLYTALSRARCLEGLQLLGDCSRTLDPDVMRWWAAHRDKEAYPVAEAQRRHPANRRGPPQPWWWMQPGLGKHIPPHENTAAKEWFADMLGFVLAKEAKEEAVVDVAKVFGVTVEALELAWAEAAKEVPLSESRAGSFLKGVRQRLWAGLGAGTADKVEGVVPTGKAEVEGGSVESPPEVMAADPQHDITRES